MEGGGEGEAGSGGGRGEGGRRTGHLPGNDVGLKQRGTPAFQEEADNRGTMERPVCPAREGRERPAPFLLDEHQERGRINRPPISMAQGPEAPVGGEGRGAKGPGG